MSTDPAESIARHIVRHLVRGLGKTEGEGVPLQKLRHWWVLSLGQRGDAFDLGLDYASHCQWVAHGPDGMILLTDLGSTKGGRPS
ncbi:hypothetical protein MicloDRAFT_00001910 [Microvirga lotononidis]|uniref:Uncharacterized protein n=1 Tax=Microvirga lotononidis TaxID=864069 RepID=I4Z4Q9_9HYPH|nr:hypothetical protein MicloDRAFT_00001910 [Microvirga lotononidis]